MRVPYAECPLCGESDFKKIIEAKVTYEYAALPKTMSWMECAVCDHVFTEGYWTDEALKIVFGRTLDKQVVGYDMERERVISDAIIQKVCQYKRSLA